jgi:ABC-2 type transport system permease protein
VEDALAVAKQKREGKQLELEQRINDLEQQVRAELAKITDPTSRRIKQEQAERRRNKLVQQYQRENQQELTQVERELESEIDSIKSFYKMWLVLVPPVLPLLMGLVVFINRRSRERLGVSSRRLRD